MDNIIEHCDEEQFANGQSRRDLRGCWDGKELKSQLMEAIDSVGRPRSLRRDLIASDSN